MELIAMNLIGYAIFFWFDILPQIRKKSWKTLWVSLPILGITLLMNVMMGLGVKFGSPNQVIVGFFKGLGLK